MSRFFFFCGHGLEKSEHFLLAEDFGDPANFWFNAFNFDATRLAFRSCVARTQLFFVDACRQVTSEMLLLNLDGIPPLEPPAYLSPDCDYNLTIKATAVNEKAYSKKNQPSFFTQALINGMEGQAARNSNDEWTVSTGALSSGITSLIRLVDP